MKKHETAGYWPSARVENFIFP